MDTNHAMEDYLNANMANGIGFELEIGNDFLIDVDMPDVVILITIFTLQNNNKNIF